MRSTLRLRNEIDNVRLATGAGTRSFEQLAAMRGAKIKRCRYRDISPISDTMGIVNGVTVITEQNLQYYPAKIRYYEVP
jgi:hypothetical protein